MRTRRAVLIGTVLCAAAGCASLFGIVDGNPYPDGGDDAAAGDADLDVMTRVEAQPPPDVSVEANTASCDDFTRTLDMGGVFLSPTGTDNGACTFATPCRSLSAQNLGIAVGKGKPLYLLQGDYPWPLDVPMGVSVVVEGGWMLDAGGWWPSCDFGLAQIHGNKTILSGQAAGYVAQGSSLTLRLVTLQNDPVTLGSAYGLFANASASVTLEAVNIHAAAGVPGEGGWMTNAVGPPECYVGNAAMGANGGSGSPGNATYGAFGYNPSKGILGTSGDAGGGGGAGTTYTGSCPGCDSGMGTDGQMVFFTCSDLGNVPTPGSPGQPGCGGGGGAGGTGGDGAGASIAVYVTGGSLVIKSGTKLTTSVGSTGGTGGSGTGGGAPTSGMSGGGFVSGHVCMGSNCGGGVMCAVEGGLGGSAGGKGGSGGQGGGGGGGASVTLAHQKNVALNVYDGSFFGFQFGGDGGSPNGQPGDQVPEITFP